MSSSSSASSSSSSSTGKSLKTAAKKRKLPELQGLENKDTALWLVKVPSFVAEQWEEAGEGEDLGAVKITAIKNDRGEIKKTIDIKIKDLKNGDCSEMEVSGEALPLKIPTEFTLEDHLDEAKLLAFSFDQKNESFSVMGKLSSMNMRPKGTKEYRDFLRDRMQSERINKRRVLSAADRAFDIVRDIDMKAHQVDFKPAAFAVLKKKKYTAERQVELDVHLLRGVILKGFSTNERLSLKEIKQICKDVPGLTESKLVQEVDNIAVYHSKGPYHSLYSLKQEYRVAMGGGKEGGGDDSSDEEEEEGEEEGEK